MKTKGIRISDLKAGKCIPLREILLRIRNSTQLTWVLLWFDITPIENKQRLLYLLQKKVNASENGLRLSFQSLIEISEGIFQEIDVLLVGCRSQEDAHRYTDDQSMYESCEFVIEMIDGGFWEIFSKDVSWIKELANQYKKIEFLNSDFQTKSES